MISGVICTKKEIDNKMHMTGILIAGIEYLFLRILCYITSSKENILMDNIYPEITINLFVGTQQ